MAANHSDPDAIAALLPDFVPLPEAPDAYFEESSRATLIPLSDLVSTRLRPKGVRNAARLMRDAAAGAADRRAPIRVARAREGSWLVLDGNSTVAVARLSGWRSIPCLVDPE